MGVGGLWLDYLNCPVMAANPDVTMAVPSIMAANPDVTVTWGIFLNDEGRGCRAVMVYDDRRRDGSHGDGGRAAGQG